jgi:starch phosphorylase
MANLAIVGSHSTNGVAAIHSELLRTITVKDLAEMFPERFNNKTNGVTPRRWLLPCNPALARTITDAIGDAWISDLSQLSKLRPLADDKGFRDTFRKSKHEAKLQFTDWLKSTTGLAVDPNTIIDNSTYENPSQLATGVNYVFVNGVPVVDEGKVTAALPGRALRGPGYRAPR